MRGAAKQFGQALHRSAAAVGLSAGPAASRADAIKKLPALQPSAAKAPPLTAKGEAAIDVARATLASSQGTASGGVPVEKRQQQLVSSALGFAATADPARSAELGAQLQTVFDRLASARGGKPDGVGAALVAGSAQQLFGPPANTDIRLALDAVRGLAAADSAQLLQSLSSVIASPEAIVPPALQLAAALAAQPGGHERLASILAKGAAGGSAPNEALAVGFTALQTRTQLGPKLGEEQRQFLQAAVDHAARRADPAARAGADAHAQQTGRTAYHAVRNGLTDRSEGSNYQQANKWLEKVSGEWIDRTAVRNTRVATKFYGGAMNSASVLTPGSFGKTIPFRKTAMLQAAKAAADAGLMPKPAQALRNLDQAAGAWLKSVAAQRGAGAAPPASVQQQALEGLMAATLRIGALGDNPKLQALSDKTKPDELPGESLHRSQMHTVRQGVSEAQFNALGLEFANEWQQLSRGKPNVAQVLGMLGRHLKAQQAAASQPAGAQAAAASPAELGRRSDGLAQAAVAQLGAVAARAGALATERPGSGNELARLARATHDVLGGLQPAWRLQALPPQQLEAIETRMGDAFAALPADVQKQWADLKTGTPAAAEVAALVHAALDQALAPQAGASPEGRALRQALDAARQPLQAAVHDTCTRRLDETVADMTTTWGDLRSPGDLAAMMASATRRIDLGSRMSMVDQRGNGLNATGFLEMLPVPFFDVLAEGFKQMDRTIEISAQGKALELFIGQSNGSSVKAGLRLNGAKIDPVGAALASLPGVNVELKAGMEHERKQGKGEGVTLRVEGDGDPESLRRAFGSVLEDLALASTMVGKDKNYTDTLGMLLDRHESLSVSNTEAQRKAHLGKTSAMVRATPKPELVQSFDSTGLAALAMGAVSAGGELASHNRRGHAESGDATGAMQISEVRVSARHNVDVSADAVGVIRGLGLYASGGDHTLRTVSREGTVLAGSTQTTQHFANPKDFAKAVAADRAAWVGMLAGHDTTPGRSAADKQAAAESRLDAMLQAALEGGRAKIKGGRRIESECQIVQALRPEAAQTWNDLQAHAQQLRAQGEPAAAEAVQQLIGELANDPRSWAPADLLVGKRGTATSGLSVPGHVQPRQVNGSGSVTHMSQRLMDSSRGS